MKKNCEWHSDRLTGEFFFKQTQNKLIFNSHKNNKKAGYNTINALLSKYPPLKWWL